MLRIEKLLRTIDLHRDTLLAGAPLAVWFDGGLGPRLHWSAGDFGISLAISAAFGLSWVGVIAWKRSRPRRSPLRSGRGNSLGEARAVTEFPGSETPLTNQGSSRPSAESPATGTEPAAVAGEHAGEGIHPSADLGNPFCVRGIDPEQLLVLAALVPGDSPDSPLGELSRAVPRPAGWEVVSARPFDPALGWGEVVLENPAGERLRVSAGEPGPILARCETSPANAVPILDAVEVFAEAHYRSVAVAEVEPAGHWQVLGVIPVQERPSELRRK